VSDESEYETYEERYKRLHDEAWERFPWAQYVAKNDVLTLTAVTRDGLEVNGRQTVDELGAYPFSHVRVRATQTATSFARIARVANWLKDAGMLMPDNVKYEDHTAVPALWVLDEKRDRGRKDRVPILAGDDPDADLNGTEVCVCDVHARGGRFRMQTAFVQRGASPEVVLDPAAPFTHDFGRAARHNDLRCTGLHLLFHRDMLYWVVKPTRPDGVVELRVGGVNVIRYVLTDLHRFVYRQRSRLSGSQDDNLGRHGECIKCFETRVGIVDDGNVRVLCHCGKHPSVRPYDPE